MLYLACMAGEKSAKNSIWAPTAFAFLWAVALELYRFRPFYGLAVSVAVFLSISIWAFRHRQHLVSRRSFWLGIGIFLLASLGALSFFSLAVAQQTVILGTAVIIWFYLNQATHQTSADLQGRMAIFIMTATYFAGVMSLLSFAIFMVQPWWLVLIIGTILYTLVAVIVWLDLEVPWATFRRALPWVAWLGAELILVAWWLPTSIYVGSAVATIVGMMFINLGRHVWRGTWEINRGRRYLIISISVLLLVLLTARWF